MEILQTMDPYERQKICDALKEERFKKGDFIITEGQAGNKFYFIEEGTAIATKQLDSAAEPTKVMEYQRGMYFGERSLLTNEVRAANVVVTSDTVDVLSLERETFTRLLGPLDQLLRRNMEVYNKVNE